MLSATRGRLVVLRDALSTQLWPVPTIGVTLAAAAGLLLPRLDRGIEEGLPEVLRDALFGGGADAARTVLNAIGSSLITVTSLTFSLTVVTLQLASSQFSPRLLRTFSRDGVVHLTLALFLATFVYSLVVLREVRTGTGEVEEFVPRLSVTVAVLLTLASVLALVGFLAHLAKQIRVEVMLSDVHEDAGQTLARALDRAGDGVAYREVAPEAVGPTGLLHAGRSGFLTSVNEDALLAAALDADAVVRVERFPGGSMVRGTPLGRAWALDGSGLDDDVLERLSACVAKAVGAGRERTAAQDVGYGLQQITDVVVKALSPGVNDPTTAVHALGHSSAVLCDALEYRLGPKLLRDEQGRARVVLDRPGLHDLLDDALAQPRRYGADAPAVLSRLAGLLREVGWMARDDDERQAVHEQLVRLRETVDAQDFGTRSATGSPPTWRRRRTRCRAAGPEAVLLRSAPVDLATVADPDDLHDEPVVPDLVDDPVVPHADPVGALLADDRAAAGRPRVGPQQLDRGAHALLVPALEPRQRLRRAPGDLDAVRRPHVSPSSAFTSSQGT